LVLVFDRQPGDTAAATDSTPIRFQVAPPEGAVFRPTGDEAAPVAVSPDGTMLVYGTFESDGSNRLWLRAVDAIEARPLVGTDHGTRPFWSPDSRSVGFFAEGKLKKIEVSGGPAIPLAEATEPRGGSWGPDDVIVFSPVAVSGLMQVPAAGGAAKPLTELGENEGSHRYPFFLPDGRHVVYLALTGHGATGAEAESDNRVFVVSLDDGEKKQLVQGAANAEFAGGRLTYYRGGQLVARPFEPEGLALSDDQEIIASDVQYDASYERGLYSVSARTLAYHAGDFLGANIVQWFGRDGAPLEQVSDEGLTFDTQISPDGRQIAYMAVDGTQTDVWVEDTQRGDRTRITFDGTLKGEPQWSPDGRVLVYSAVVDGQRSIFRKPISGSGEAELLLSIDGIELFSSQWSRDGQYLMLAVTDPLGNTDLWAVRVDAEGYVDGAPFPTVQSIEDKEKSPQLSPDGRWLAYAANESGRWEVFVTSFPEARGKWQVSPAGGLEPLWRGDGKALFFRSSANAIMEAEVSADGDRFDVGAVESLFKVFSTAELDGSNYDVSADGQRFIVHTISEEQARAPLTVVVGW
jgi:Tol biopolymer transport system component